MQHAGLIAGYDNKIFYIESGHEALEIHRKERADLLIMAPDFPDMTCEEFVPYYQGR